MAAFTPVMILLGSVCMPCCGFQTSS
jgi:hypothetical protein